MNESERTDALWIAAQNGEKPPSECFATKPTTTHTSAGVDPGADQEDGRLLNVVSTSLEHRLYLLLLDAAHKSAHGTTAGYLRNLIWRELAPHGLAPMVSQPTTNAHGGGLKSLDFIDLI